ncbi:MAG: PilZ domain-containing protein [Vicinamibacteria bacterium]|nr:PilZ domain-containing protein [Vicinamibacteria bacterium]
MTDRRHTRRRTMSNVRSGVLSVGSRKHIVAVVDLSPEGAFLTTRAEVSAADEMTLELMLPRRSRVVRLPCRLVWRSERFDATTGHPAGIAVRFEPLDAETNRHIEEFARTGFRLSEQPATSRYEYIIIERKDVDVDELNQLGREGWALVATPLSRRGMRLVLMRPL